MSKKPKKKNDFETILKMVNNGVGISMCPDIVQVVRRSAKKGGGGNVTFGVPDPAFDDVVNITTGKDKHRAFCLIVDWEEFKRVERELYGK